MKISRILSLVALGGSLVAVGSTGCSSDTDETPPGSTAPAGGSGGAGGGTGAGAEGGAGGSTINDESTSCADAVVMEERENYRGVWGSGILNPPGDKDYYSFTATEGDFIVIGTTANEDDDPDMIDTVVTLFDSAGNQLAQDDDAVPRASTDSEMYYHVPETGTYCIEVLEFSDWAGEALEGAPNFLFDVYAIPIDFATLEGYTQDTGDNDTLGTAQTPLNLSGSFTALMGMLDPGTDVDVYQLEPAESAVAIHTFDMPDGPGTGYPNIGMGSTQGPGLINIWSQVGANNPQLYAQLDHQLGSEGMSVPLLSGANTTYFLEITRPNDTLGANDFYVIKQTTSDTDNQWEQANGSNGTLGGAEVATPQADGSFTRHFVMGESSNADVDYWSFEVTAGQSIILACGAARSGSGLVGLTVAVHDDGDNELQVETEGDDADIVWSTSPTASMAPVPIATTGTYYLRVSAAGQNANVSSSFYRCGIHIGTL